MPLYCGKKLPEVREFESELCHLTWKAFSVNPAVNWYLFQIREGKGSERRGICSAINMLCPGCSGFLTSTAPIRLRAAFTFLWCIVQYRLAIKLLAAFINNSRPKAKRHPTFDM